MKRLHNLSVSKCASCEGVVGPLSRKKIVGYLRHLRDWRLVSRARAIRAEYRMKDFMSAVRSIQKIARLAEREGHHPDLHLTGYRHLTVELSTHSIGGLSENDFILAKEIERIISETARQSRGTR